MARLDREALAAFHRRAVTPGGLALVLVGDLEAARALDSGVGPAGGLAGCARRRGRARAAAARRAPHDRPPMMNKSQADIAYGFATVARSDPAYNAFWVMNTVLGQYGMGGRLGDNIRERQGMAYYVYSAFDPALVAAPLIVRAGVDGANVDRTIEAIDTEIAALARDGATLEEFEDTRRFLVASMPRLLETNAGIADFLQMSEFFGLGLDYDVRVPDELAAVTLDDVHAAAKRLDPARAVVAVAGPYAGDADGRQGRLAARVTDMGATRAVFFDVDFTLIYPGPTFQGEGYRAFCAKHGVRVDASRFAAAVAGASAVLDDAQDQAYDPQIFIDYTSRVIQGMGGTGQPAIALAAREMYDEWAGNQHFLLYEDVPDVLASLRRAGAARRPDLELAPVPGLVPEPLRARRPHHGRRLLVRARLHEAAPEHLRGRDAAGGRRAGRVGHGGRQPGAGHRRRAAPRHARRARRPLGPPVRPRAGRRARHPVAPGAGGVAVERDGARTRVRWGRPR